MYAIIRQGDGKFYTSRLFGWFTLDSQDRAFSTFGIVLNQNKSKLVKVPEYNGNKRPYLDLEVLVCDFDDSSWVNGDSCGAENFIPMNEILSMIDENRVPKDLLEKCIEIDSLYEYKEWHQVKSDKEIENLMWVSGHFHDARIKDMRLEADTLTVVMSDCWGCSIELRFSGDVAYETESRDPENYDPYWSDSTLVFFDRYIWFVDDMEKNPKEISNGNCWFRARNLEYKIIPD